jgi:hypothetical protein
MLAISLTTPIYFSLSRWKDEDIITLDYTDPNIDEN